MTTATTTTTVLGRVPYANCAPFFTGLTVGAPWQAADLTPRQLGEQAARGQLAAGPMALADFLRLQDQYERLGALGIAARGRVGSVLLFSKKPIRQLDGGTIAITEDTSTSVVLLRLILEQRYLIAPKTYQRGEAADADATLVIGDEALRVRAQSRAYPYEYDLAFEWWLWQHLPAVFAVWAVKKTLGATERQQLSRQVQHQLAVNLGRLGELATACAERAGISPAEMQAYLENFVYRFSEPEEQAIRVFAQLAHDHHLL